MSDYLPIEHYGVIGDLHTVALVGMNGSIDFMCFPEFDSPSIFAALLDRDRGGYFSLCPMIEGAREKQLYIPDSNILLSRFLSEGAIAEISDFMAADEDGLGHRLIRRAKSVHGEVPFRMVCRPAFNYARSGHRIERTEEGVVFHSDGPDGLSMCLRTSADVKIHNGAAVAEFTLSGGQNQSFVLEQVQEGAESPSAHPDFVREAFKRTNDFWHRWINRSKYRGRWREMVNRSALTLKMLTSKRHGSIVAAPTFGIPETLGGERNWDYRYTWIRDASFTLYGLIRLGYTDEAADFMRWIEARCNDLNEDGSLQIMYGIDGRKDLYEEELPHLRGYANSRPVRIGNGAYDHLQLDIYGELMDSVYLYDKYGEPISYDLWQNLVRLINWVCANWEQPDEGIWEVRGGRQEFLYSRVLCWVAVDRGVRLALKRSLPAPLDKWLHERNRIHASIYEDFWDTGLNAFVQYKGARNMDASALLMPMVRFIGPTDPRWLSTLRAIEHELVEDSLVYRYRTDVAAHDGFEAPEGTFTMCSFWYVECLSRSRDFPKARFFFEKMLGYANHLGLFSEELGASGQHLGNFPQAFTHLGLISAAYNLDKQLGNVRGL